MAKVWFFILTLALFLSACAPEPIPTPFPLPTPTPSPLPQDVVALVNDQPIFRKTLEKHLMLLQKAMEASGETPDPQTVEQMRYQILEGLIDQAIMEQAAAKLGIKVTAEELEEHVQRTIQEGGKEDFNRWLEESGLTLEEFREMTRMQLLSLKLFEAVVPPPPQTMEQVRARHILLTSEEEAERILKRIKNGEDFASLARQYSQDEFTRESGGDLGFFPRGLSGLPPELEQVAFSLAPGQVSGVVKSYYGYHIIQVLERDPTHPLSEEAKRLFREWKFKEWLEKERASARIQRFLK
ncbi:MAG: peptidylprolyl isomerase [Anaerolineae bacterium]|nr:peptidylprolyl isomerase [Anaerolineae bacterium]MDW8101451.1 peptidylprolyl isomerase [Anaerolineae bacterium]